MNICRIQLTLNENIFNAGIALFKENWSEQQAFLNYFTKEWVEKNFGLYEGYTQGFPSTNNASESFNRTIKDQKMFTCRKAIGQFLSLIKDNIVQNWS